jgi:ABC-2 type transport system ATP-binding protein
MDPEGIVWMRAFLRSLAAEGKAVLVSSHLMSELQDTADHIVVVGRGRAIADARVAELLSSAADGRVTVRTSAVAPALAVLAEAGAAATATGPDTIVVRGLPTDRIIAVLSRDGVPFSELAAHRATLEEAYMALTRDEVEFRPRPADDSVAVDGRSARPADASAAADRRPATSGDAR